MKLIKALKFSIIIFSMILFFSSLVMAQVCNLTEVLPMAFKNENFFNDLASRQSTTKMALEQNFGSYAPSSSVYNLMMTDRDLGNTWAGFDNPNRNIPRLTITPSGFVAPW